MAALICDVTRRIQKLIYSHTLPKHAINKLFVYRVFGEHVPNICVPIIIIKQQKYLVL